jgi:uncharacterized protein YbbK (DUF523 family)
VAVTGEATTQGDSSQRLIDVTNLCVSEFESLVQYVLMRRAPSCGSEESQELPLAVFTQSGKFLQVNMGRWVYIDLT